ncbi:MULTISPECIES: tRNA lysidine(34) synthetase TilS [unclassified Microbulbifer]|uniref:tRNA lysidine(34) synthetase TilS n=1 Tax=unclassified Microbulbifer TaxID=2619833 RepID=UPI0027E5777A|nr:MULTISPECIES: tRNA lysidine(34) synthetase TilS [unclassified Microbulbifer]
MNAILETLKAALARHPCDGRYWLGYSGGLDSSVLLHLLVAEGIPVRAVHVHHGLSPNADRWQAHCEETAGALGVPIVTRDVSVDPADGGLEQAARRARYRVFAGLLKEGDQLLLAQHGDDQVETFFLRLLRGAGVLGLAAMAESRPLGAGSLLRPLLGCGRNQLESYAREQGLNWIEDESNADQRLERNYLRAVVLPLLSERWPLRRRVARATENLREAAELLREVGVDDLSGCGRRDERFGESLELAALRQLSAPRRRNLLRTWLAESGGAMPEAGHLEEALVQVLESAGDSRPAVALGGRVARRFRQRLYITPPLPAADLSGEWQWNGAGTLALPGGWVLEPGPDWPAGNYLVRFRRGGERARSAGRKHSQTLKKLLQEQALEPWLRDLVPLVHRGGELVAVGDIFLCGEGVAGTLKWRYGGACE